MTKTRKAIKVTVALALVALTAIILAVAPACSCKTYSHKTFDYDAIVFRDVEPGKLDEDIAYARSKIGVNQTALVGGINRVVDTINEIAANYKYAYIEYCKDTTGKYKKIYTDYDSMYNDAYKKYMDLLYDALQAYPNGLFDEQSKQTILANHRTMDDEYLQLQKDITALETAYNDLKIDNYETYANAAADILIQLVAKNNAIAAKAGMDNYIEYAYANYGRAYDAADAAAMTSYVKEYIGPLLDDAIDGVNDAAAKIASREDVINLDYAARGEDETDRNYGAVEAHAKEIGAYMSEALSYLGECNLHYKANENKNPNGVEGAFTSYLEKYDAPYIYQFCSGGYSDLLTFVHEFGHFTAFYNLGGGASYDLDVAEVHSQANEMLFMPRLYEIYGNKVGDYLVKSQLFDILYWSVTMGCLQDEFQRIIYTEPEKYATADAINDLYESLTVEYNADGYGEGIGERVGYNFNRYWWAEVSHTFSSPFYYISYAMSALPALTIYEDSMETTRASAITEYNAIQTYGNGNYTFEEVLSKAGVASPFDKRTIKDLADFLKRQFAA